MSISKRILNNSAYAEAYRSGYGKGRADERAKVLILADCEDKECWDCAFGRAEGCILKQVEEKNHD